LDDLVRVKTRTEGRDSGTGEYRLGEEERRGKWLDYVMGCTQVLRRGGLGIAGAELEIESDVPMGAGLSSSAALIVAVLRAFRESYALELDDVKLALLGQKAENDLVGAPVGVMDHMSASLGQAGSALFLDTRSLDYRALPLPAGDLVVIGSGIAHAHAGGEYRKRRSECEAAAHALGVEQLRELDDVDAHDVTRTRIEQLPEALRKRVRHVMTENARVLDAVKAIEAGNPARLGELMVQSHISMRDDFEVSLPAIDTLVAIAIADPDVFGARLTGGGFGGAVVVLARPRTGPAMADRVAAQYGRRTDHEARVLVGGSEPFVPS
jgi:galactokinase